MIVRFAKLKTGYIISVYLVHPSLAPIAMVRGGFISARQVKWKKLNGETEEIHYHLKEKTMHIKITDISHSDKIAPTYDYLQKRNKK